MRLRSHAIVATLLFAGLASPVLGAHVVHLVPKMPMSLDVAPLPRTFFMHSIDVNYPGGRVILASNPDGTGNLHTNDELQIAVVHADGTASWYRHDYAGAPTKSPGETPPLDVTALFRPGSNHIEIRMLDLYGSRFGAKDYYVVSFADSEAVPRTIAARPHQPKPEAFIYAETPVFVGSSPGPIELCVVSPRDTEQATAQIEVRGTHGGQPELMTLTLRPGFNRTVIPLGDVRAGTYTISGAVKIGDHTLEILPHPVSKIEPSFAEGDIAQILADLAGRVKADQAQIKAGKDARAAAADALWTRAVMERIRRAPACQPEAAPDPNDIEARAKLLLSCSRLVETGAVGRTLVDQLHVLQGQYLDWGHLRYAKMAGAPGRVHYEHGAERMEGTYDNLTIYWANLPLAAVLRLIPMHLKKMAPASDWPEAEERGATRVTVAGQPALLFQGWNDGIWLATRTSRFDLQVDASSRATAMRLAEIGLAEQPVTPQVADAVLADLKPPVAVRGIRALMGLVSQPGVTPALRRSASLVAEGRFGEAAMAIPGPIADCNPRRTLYAFGAGGQPSATPALPDAGPAIACWSEGSGRQYLLLQYDSPAARREAAATLVAVLDLLPGRQMLVGDLHQHSNVSDGMGEPQEMFFQTVSHFTDFHSLTDHNEVKGAQAIAAELPSWGMDYPFFVGEEVTRDFAHIVAVDPDGRVDEKGEPAEVVKRIHDSGAVSILAHPWDTPFQKTYRKNPFAQPKIDVFQHNPLWYAQWRRNGTIPPMVEVTDTHDMSLAWPYRGIVFAEKPTNASIKQALLDGDCCAWTPVGPRGPERIARVVWALISDREYYEDQQLQRLVKRVMELK